MKKVTLLMVSLSLFPRLLAAQDFDLDKLAGEEWYGLYMNGQKSGYAVERMTVADDGSVALEEDARFHTTMMGVKQDMRIVSKREYGPDRRLLSVSEQIDEASGTSLFDARIEGDSLVLRASMGGATTEKTLPRPDESLEDALKQHRLVGDGASVGDEVRYSLFEPMLGKESGVVSRIVGVEERPFEGVPTKVFRIETRMIDLNIDTVSYVAEDGTTLEDVVAGMLTMRLEPEEVARDVHYSNDVIVSNAAMVDEPVPDPRTRDSLKLRLHGPLTSAHLYNDERQFLAAQGDAFVFVGTRPALDGVAPRRLPIEDEGVAEWTRPTLFIQSEEPALVAKAREILGEEADAAAASAKLCTWVYENVRTTFSARLSNALEVLGSLEGDCTEHSVLFVGLARAAGLPAREVAGLIYVEGAKPGFYFHQWAKVWIGQWIDVDPTFNQPVADVTHIKLVEGDLFKQVQLLPIIGQIRIEVLDQDAVPEAAPAAPGEPAAAVEQEPVHEPQRAQGAGGGRMRGAGVAFGVVMAAMLLTLTAGCGLLSKYRNKPTAPTDLGALESQAERILDHIAGGAGPFDAPSLDMGEHLARLRKRHSQVVALKEEHCLGEDNRGYVDLRCDSDEAKAYLDDTKRENEAQRIVAAENEDRKDLYREIARLRDEANVTLTVVERVYARKRLLRAGPGAAVQLPENAEDLEAVRASELGRKLGSDCVAGAWIALP
ncbi:MAG: DUF1318 domain-containing protein [Candidatus Hydrogenedentes bacterium]|nr:DUF1318 domain-containing protein [Candidatus Hydrogenedentota bacterium]